MVRENPLDEKYPLFRQWDNPSKEVRYSFRINGTATIIKRFVILVIVVTPNKVSPIKTGIKLNIRKDRVTIDGLLSQK